MRIVTDAEQGPVPAPRNWMPSDGPGWPKGVNGDTRRCGVNPDAGQHQDRSAPPQRSDRFVAGHTARQTIAERPSTEVTRRARKDTAQPASSGRKRRTTPSVANHCRRIKEAPRRRWTGAIPPLPLGAPGGKPVQRRSSRRRLRGDIQQNRGKYGRRIHKPRYTEASRIDAVSGGQAEAKAPGISSRNRRI